MNTTNTPKTLIFFLILVLVWGTGCSGLYSRGQESSGAEQENPEYGDNGETPGDSGETPGSEGETPGDSGETPPPADPALPEKVYIQVRFDLHDSSGGLYNTDLSFGISGIEFQYEAFGLQTGDLIKGVYHDNPKGYVWPYGFIVKYGGSKDFYGPDNQVIAKKNVGIDYYVGNDNLYVIPERAGNTSAKVYLVFYFKPAYAYSRETVSFTIPWDDYNPELYTDKALFHIEGTDKKFTVTFEGFEKKALDGSQ